MGDRPGKLKFAGACAAAIAGAVLAAAAASAQGPGDYQPTTTLPGPGDTHVSFRAKASAGDRLHTYIRVDVECRERCSAQGKGRVRLTGIPGEGPSSESFRLGQDDATISGGKTKLELRVPKDARRIAQAKKFDGRVRAKVVVTATDTAGNTGREELRLKFRDSR
jgi:hypothetical protein